MIDRTEMEKTHQSLEKDFGKGTIIIASQESKDVDFIPTGSVGLDQATGIGGYPVGRIVEIYGPESSGKTTLLLEATREAQIKFPDRVTAIIDMEHALDLSYAEALGIDLDRLHLAQPSHGEEALEIVNRLLRCRAYSLIGVDSVAALITKAEIEGEVGDANMAPQARLMSQAMRMLSPLTGAAGTTVIFTNQLRSKVGRMQGNPETTCGGNALKFYASMRLDVRKKAMNKEGGAGEEEKDSNGYKKFTDGEEFVSNTVWVKVVKNKLCAPFRAAEFDILFGEGIDRTQEIFSLAVRKEIIKKAGSWYSFQGKRLGQGEANVLDLLRDNIEFVMDLEKLLKPTADESKDKEVAQEGKAPSL